jgi:hypothetical protein
MSSTDHKPTQPDEAVVRTSSATESRRRAWIAVALIPVVFILGFMLAQGLYSLMGYLPENTVPLWVDLVASGVTVAVCLVPCGAAVLYGRRASSVGDRRGIVPLLVGALAGLGVVILTVGTIVTTPHL